MRQVNLYAYDKQLRPEVIGADFEDGDPNHSYTIRYEKQGNYILNSLTGEKRGKKEEI